MSELPKIFIGSSREGLEIAQAVQLSLKGVAECIVWNQGAFQLGKAILDNFYGFLDEFDLALFVATPDDVTHMRDKAFTSVRDNVLFEFGLFMGGLGKERVILITPDHHDDLHLPSDLSGMVTTFYEASRGEEVLAAVNPACFQIRQHIRKVYNINSSRARRKGVGYAGTVCFRRFDDKIE